MPILVTAFEPFGGDALNASQEILNALPATLGGVRLEKRLLPVSFCFAPRLALEAAERLRPEAIVCLGQAAGRDAVTPERPRFKNSSANTAPCAAVISPRSFMRPDAARRSGACRRKRAFISPS